MNMSRFILLAGVAGLCAAGCSSPAEEGEPDPAPTAPPPGFLNGTLGQGGASGQQVGQAGTGGTGVLPTAGTGGAPAATAGTGGAPAAAAGTGGTGGAPSTIPTGSGNLIMHDAMGWVAGNTNGLGIQGSFYEFGDFTGTPPGVTTVELDDFSASPTSVCASGIASQVLTPAGAAQPAYGQYWGGGVGLNLSDPGGNMGAGPWDRRTVTGFSFNITGTAVPPAGQLRFKVTLVGDDDGFCTNAASGPNTFQLGALVKECYQGGAGDPPLAATAPLVALQWQVATVEAASTPFDFCIENLTALTSP